MKTAFTILVALISTTMRSAEYREFPSVERPWIVTSVSKLPAGVRPFDPSDPQRAIDSVRVWRVDVDADGRLDLAIEGIGGGSGGPYVRIYRNDAAGFQEVLSTQGWIESLGVVDGTPRLEVWARAGGGEYSVTRVCWKSGAFVEEYTDWLMQDEECRLQVTRRTYPRNSPTRRQSQRPGLSRSVLRVARLAPATVVAHL